MDAQNATDEPSPAPMGRSEVTAALPGLHLHKNNHTCEKKRDVGEGQHSAHCEI
jgi:hypothetical protein